MQNLFLSREGKIDPKEHAIQHLALLQMATCYTESVQYLERGKTEALDETEWWLVEKHSMRKLKPEFDAEVFHFCYTGSKANMRIHLTLI